MEDTNLKITGTPFFIPADNENLIRVRQHFGKTRIIEAFLNEEINLKDLKDNESVCAGDGEHFYFKLTLKSQ